MSTDRQQAIRYFNGPARGLGPDNLGAPVVVKNDFWAPEQELEIIPALQRGLAAPRQPAK